MLVRSLSVKVKEKPTMKLFVRVLLNISVANTSTYLLWSAFSFWIYLETRSVLVLSVLSGTYMLLVTLSSMFFGTIVDKHKKKRVIAGASAVTMALLLMASAVFFLSDTTHLSDMSSPVFWLFSLPLLLSALTGNLRSITLSTLVSILVPKQDYGRANGLVGTVQGFGMIANTVLSGLIIGYLGMSWAIMITLFLSAVTLVHLFSLPFPKNVLYTTRTCKQTNRFQGSLQGDPLSAGIDGINFLHHLQQFYWRRFFCVNRSLWTDSFFGRTLGNYSGLHRYRIYPGRITHR